MIKEIQLIEPLSCTAKESAVDVAKKLKESIQRHIYVLEKNYPIGIISTTDINNKIVAEGKDPNKVVAKDVMSTPIEVHDVNDDETEVYKEMVEKKRLTCAIVENKKFVGILSINRLINHIARG